VDMKFDTWNVEALCKTAALKFLLPQLQEYKLYIAIRLWAGHVVRKEKYPIQNKALQQTFHIRRRAGKMGNGVIEDAVALLGTSS